MLEIKDKSIFLSITALVEILFSLLIGPTSLVFGLMWALGDTISIVTDVGGNLTGLGLILGPPMILVGFVALYGIVSGLELLQCKERARRFTLIFFGLISIISLTAPGIVSIPLSFLKIQPSIAASFGFVVMSFVFIIYLMSPQVKGRFKHEKTPLFSSKLLRLYLALLVLFSLLAFGLVAGSLMNESPENKTYRRQQYQNKKYYDQQAKLILEDLQKHKTVRIRFHVAYGVQTSLGGQAQRASFAERTKIHDEMMNKYVVDYLKDDLITSKSANDSVSYFAEVTQTGYYRLRSNQYVKWIKLEADPEKE